MPTLAGAAPRLRSLNMSWLAMVNDWGLGQLTAMVDMQDLNLRATGEGGRGSGQDRVGCAAAIFDSWPCQ
jgi:hypothetical protein